MELKSPSGKPSSLWASINGRFDPDRAVRILGAKLTGSKATRALKRDQRKLWYESLCAWIIANDDQSFIRDSAVRRVGSWLSTMHDGEMLRLKDSPGESLVTVALGLHATKLAEKIVEPMGGIAALMSVRSADDLKQDQDGYTESARSAVDLLAIAHLYWSTAGTLGYPEKLSPELCCDLASKLQERRKSLKISETALGPETLRKRWNRVTRSAPLIYAASLLEYAGASLFERIFGNSTAPTQEKPTRWFALAKRISRDLNMNMKFHRDAKPAFVRFPKAIKRAKRLPPPKLRACEVIWLSERFNEADSDWPEVVAQIEKLSGKACAASKQSHAGDCVACALFKGLDREQLPEFRSGR